MNVVDPSSRGFYWWYHEPSRMLVFAVAFGLGPRVAAENLVLDLEVTTQDLHWRCTDDSQVPDSIEVDLFLNFGVLEQVPGLRPQRRVWVDCVDWLRTTLPAHIQDYDLLLREAFFPSEESEEKGSPLKWRDVQPLIRPGRRDEVPDWELVVLSFGGVFTPYSSDVHSVEMPIAFMRGVASATRSSAKRVVAFLPDKLRAFAERFVDIHQAMDLVPLGRTAFRNALCRCGLLLCQPGLYTPFEALKMGLPFALAFPMSFTQAMQSERLASLGVKAHPPIFHEALSEGPVRQSIESAEAEWFAKSRTQWRMQLAARTEDKVTSFVRSILDSPTSDLTVPTPSGPTTTASSAIRHERQT